MITEKASADLKSKIDSKLKSKSSEKEKKEEEDYESTAPYSLKNTESLPIFSTEPQFCISRTILEVYKTDEENWEQYVPNGGAVEEDEESSDTETEEEEEEEEEEEDEDTKGFKLHQGEILETYYYGRFTEISSEHDYEDMSNNGSVKIPEIIDLDRFYKGVRLCLRKTWEEEGKTTNLEDLVETLKGFITEESFTEAGMNISISGMSILLDQKYQFDFHQMKRSEIIREVIKTAGLKPVVNPEGLQDDVIDYTNIKSSGDSSDASGDASGAPNISSMVKQAIKGKKGARAKTEAIYSAMVNHLVYSYYSCSHFPHSNEGADQAWQHGAVNCADSASIGRVAYNAGGMQARVVHGPNHFWCEVNVDGNWIASDVTGSEGAHCVRSLGQVWDGLSKDSDNGDWPSC